MRTLFPSVLVGFLCVSAYAIFGYLNNRSYQESNAALQSSNKTLREHLEVKDELVTNLCDINDQITAKSNIYIISHFPFAGEPWTVEKYWRQEELWIALQSYNSRDAAEDVKAQLESGELKVRDLFR
jgi:plasmid maintenance system antidote protein VapI